MRLMLGYGTEPSLLVNVDNGYDPSHFEFRVVNGGWSGIFNNGHLTVLGPPSGDFSSTEKIEIICDNQNRLRSVPYEYETVFENFANPDYFAPDKYIAPSFDDLDDDIPF